MKRKPAARIGFADWIGEVLDGLAADGEAGNAALEQRVAGEVRELCARFPIYPDLSYV